MSQKQGRNELCSCGSQKKYKKCCGLKTSKRVFSLSSSPSSLIGPQIIANKGQAASLSGKNIKTMSTTKSIFPKQT